MANEILDLITALLPVIGKFGPKLVHDVADLISGNPQQQGEADEAYIGRLNTLIDEKLNDAAQKDAAIEKG